MEEKKIFSVPKLHLGHCAKAFGLRKSPKAAMAERKKRGAMAKSKNARVNDHQEHQRLANNSGGVTILKRKMVSEFDAGDNTFGKRPKMLQNK